VPPARAAVSSADRCAACVALAAARLYRQARRWDAASMPRYDDHHALRAHETGYGPVVTSERYDAVQDAACVPRTTGAKGTTTLTSRRWEASPHGRRGGTAPSARRAAQPAPAERPVHRLRSGARPSCFSADQRDFDCVFLQKVELCDKNDRYESCR
jgi:hypothetical protein